MVTDIPLISDLIEKGFVDCSDHRWRVHAYLAVEVRQWCYEHIGPIETQTYSYTGHQNEVMFETYENLLNTDVIPITFSSFADFLAFKMRWL
jgi:hypothetical protein